MPEGTAKKTNVNDKGKTKRKSPIEVNVTKKHQDREEKIWLQIETI